ncbi:MAG: hypothetical protein F6K58_14265 [Symploca sp. SIO2E9]|nr:hypothetical protein [Symploca sp. SIO2E9]
MTYADTDQEFLLVEGEEEAPNYPVAFGVTLTPKVGGIIIGVLGIAGAAYLLLNAVQPTWQKYRELQQDIESKKLQIKTKEEIQQQIELKQAQLEEAKDKNRQVLSLFASEQTLDTLLLDLNSFVKDTNGNLKSFTPVEPEPVVINDGSLGPLVNGKLKRRSIDLELEGSFQQLQSVMRSFERLQALMLVNNFQSDVSTPQALVINNGRVVLGPQPTLKTTFRLDALLPLTEQEQEEAEAAAESSKKKK